MLVRAFLRVHLRNSVLRSAFQASGYEREAGTVVAAGDAGKH